MTRPAPHSLPEALPKSSIRTVKLAGGLLFIRGLGRFLNCMGYHLLVVALIAVFAAAALSGSGEIKIRLADASIKTAVGLVLTIAGAASFVLGSVAWLRWVIAPDAPPVQGWQRLHWRYLGRMVLMIVIFWLLSLAFAFVLLVIVAGSSGNSDTDLAASIGSAVALPLFVDAFGLVTAVIFLAVFASRFSLSFAGAAMGTPSGFLDANDANRPVRMHSFLAFAVVIGFSYLVSVLIGESPIPSTLEHHLISASGSVVSVLVSGGINFVLYLIDLFTYGLCLTLAGLYYRHLVDEKAEPV